MLYFDPKDDKGNKESLDASLKYFKALFMQVGEIL